MLFEELTELTPVSTKQPSLVHGFGPRNAKAAPVIRHPKTSILVRRQAYDHTSTAHDVRVPGS
jgi:hypothetical protein